MGYQYNLAQLISLQVVDGDSVLLFIKKSKFFYKSGHINRLDILPVDILSGVYCKRNTVFVGRIR